MKTEQKTEILNALLSGQKSYRQLPSGRSHKLSGCLRELLNYGFIAHVPNRAEYFTYKITQTGREFVEEMKSFA